MIQLSTGALDEIVVVGAHCDDIAIGMGGTLLDSGQSQFGGYECGPSCFPVVPPSGKPKSWKRSRHSVPMPMST